MQAVYNSVSIGFTAVVQILGIVSSVMNLFEAVVYSTLKGLSVGLLTVVVTFILFNQTMAGVYEESERARKSWGTICYKWFVKFHRSARNVSCNVGSFYYVDKQLFLTLLNIIASNTANLVLTYKS